LRQRPDKKVGPRDTPKRTDRSGIEQSEKPHADGFGPRPDAKTEKRDKAPDAKTKKPKPKPRPQTRRKR